MPCMVSTDGGMTINFLRICVIIVFVVYICLFILVFTEQLKSIAVDHKSLRPFLPRGLVNRGNMCYVHTVS